jgi:hypothetical protein
MMVVSPLLSVRVVPSRVIAAPGVSVCDPMMTTGTWVMAFGSLGKTPGGDCEGCLTFGLFGASGKGVMTVTMITMTEDDD